MRWDLFCRVIDNYGDLGVCRRLAADLIQHGQTVRLWVDDAALAQRMCDPLEGYELIDWRNPPPAMRLGEVVVEAFGCDPPPDFVEAMKQRAAPPVWINLEYLSAEPYVARSHGLPSPQLTGPGAGLVKWFFFPGFTADTGGLLREEGLLREQAAFDRHRWLAQWGLPPQEGEQVVSLFAYPSAPVERLLDSWRKDSQPRWLLCTSGPLQQRVQDWLAQASVAGLHGQADREGRVGGLRITALPWLHHREFDRLLWACDLNFVRGEDSLVRALWAGQPFIWQLYPQSDGAHAAKLDAFIGEFAGVLRRLGPQGSAQTLEQWRPLWLAWNGLRDWPDDDAPALPPSGAVSAWRAELRRQPSLTTRLLAFVASRSSAAALG